jgi:PiT family inorganic phosphate transporter
VATGSILGSGVGKPGAQVRWRVAGRMVAAWLITLPAAAIVGAIMWYLGDTVGGLGGAIVDFVILVGLAVFMYLRSRKEPVSHENVNDDWEDALAEPRVPAGAAS